MRLAAIVFVGLTGLATLSAQQQGQIPPPTVPPPIPPTTLPIGTSKPVGPKAPGVPIRSETAVIVGTVVDAGGRGVPRAAVRLIGDTVIETVLTDDRGRF